MRKRMAFVLLMLIFFSQVGYYGLFAIEQELIRYEQKRKLLSTLGNDELERIPWEASMQFMDDDQEFALNGNRYDIVRTTVEDGIRVYYAVNDKNETLLLKKLADAGKSQGQQQGAKKGILKIASLYCTPSHTIHIPPVPAHLILRPVLPHHYGTSHQQKMVQPPDHSGSYPS